MIKAKLVCRHSRGCKWITNSRGMDHDVLRRAAIEKEVSRYLESTLTLSLALKAASKFSQGAECREGKGSVLRTTSLKGTFNICFWVQVEGLDVQWVVRFPILGKLPHSAQLAKLDSEVATMKFLQQKTSVRVPRLIGFGLRDDDVGVPFIITENLRAMPLQFYWNIHGKKPENAERVLKSLAQQYLSLLSHPFDRIGSLRLTQDHSSWEIGSGPLSADQYDMSHDRVTIQISPPMSSSLDYYRSQSQLWERRMKEQRNSVYDEEDALQKYVTAEVFRRIVPFYASAQFTHGPFFLCHLDLHFANIFINHKHEVEAILDWEFSAILPIEVASAPPPYFVKHDVDQLKIGSEHYQTFASRLEIFTKHVQASLHSTLSPILSNEACQCIQDRLNGAIDKRYAYFAWASSDARKMFAIVWDHFALSTPLRLDRDETTSDFLRISDERDGELFDTEQQVVDAVIERRSPLEVKAWVTERLTELEIYREERKRAGLDKVIPKN